VIVVQQTVYQLSHTRFRWQIAVRTRDTLHASQYTSPWSSYKRRRFRDGVSRIFGRPSEEDLRTSFDRNRWFAP